MVFWKILLAHVLTDFVLQFDALAENKRKLKFLLLHCLIFFLVSVLVLLPLFSLSSLIALALVSVFHGLVDTLKQWAERRSPRNHWLFFLADQAAHVLAIGAAAVFLEEGSFSLVVETLAQSWSEPSFFMVGSFFVLIVFGMSYFIGILCRSFLDLSRRDRKPGMERAGRYLGMLERSLVLTAVLIGKIEFIGYIFAAKSIARYPEMKEESHFAEYYLVGTLTSVTIAFFGGLLLKYLLGW